MATTLSPAAARALADWQDGRTPRREPVRAPRADTLAARFEAENEAALKRRALNGNLRGRKVC